MDSKINSSRVQVHMETIPIELGTAPDFSGLDSELVSPETYDEVVSNHSRRTTSDTDDERPPIIPPNNILRCKTKHNFSTFNARTLAPVGRVDELLFCCQ